MLHASFAQQNYRFCRGDQDEDDTENVVSHKNFPSRQIDEACENARFCNGQNQSINQLFPLPVQAPPPCTTNPASEPLQLQPPSVGLARGHTGESKAVLSHKRNPDCIREIASKVSAAQLPADEQRKPNRDKRQKRRRDGLCVSVAS